MNYFNVGSEALDAINTVLMEVVRRSKLNFDAKQPITDDIEVLMDNSTNLEDFYSSLLIHHNNKLVDLRKGFPLESKFLQIMGLEKEELLSAEANLSVCIYCYRVPNCTNLGNQIKKGREQ